MQATVSRYEEFALDRNGTPFWAYRAVVEFTMDGAPTPQAVGRAAAKTLRRLGMRPDDTLWTTTTPTTSISGERFTRVRVTVKD